MKTFIQTGIILTLLSFSMDANAISMGELLGQVTIRETKQPVAFAEVIFENNFDKIVVQADAHGYYYSNHMPTGKYQMRVVYNNRTFIMNRVRVYDSYTLEVNFKVSNNEELAQEVEVKQEFPLTSSVESTDIRIANDEGMVPTRTLTETLMMQPGVDVVDGYVYVKGALAKFFIDGTPVIGPTRIW